MAGAEILVIILSIFLAIFLIVGIILGVLLIRLTLQVKRITSSAKMAAENIESMAARISTMSSLSGIGKMVFKRAKKMKRKRREEQ